MVPVVRTVHIQTMDSEHHFQRIRKQNMKDLKKVASLLNIKMK